MPSYSELIQMAKANSERGAQHLEDMKRHKEEQDEHARAQSKRKEDERRRAQDEISKRRKTTELRNKEVEADRLNQRKKARSMQSHSQNVTSSLASRNRASSSDKSTKPAKQQEVLTREEKRNIKQKKDFGEYGARQKSKSQQKPHQDNYQSGGLIALNTKKRDTRTIEEIQHDLKSKKSIDNGHSKSDTRQSISKRKAPSLPDLSKRKTASKDSKNDIDSDDSISNDVDSDGGDGYNSHDIWSLFGKDKAKYLERDYDSNESDADMEATNEDVIDEELSSSRFGKKEDEREAADLRRHELEKKRRKLNK